MDDLLGETGTLALTIRLKDYESAERDLARYSELSRQFDRLVVTLDVSGTDIGEFQRNNRQNQEALATLLNDTRRFEDLQRLEIEVRGDDEQHMAVVYEGEALRRKMQEGFAAYAGREAETTRIAEHYGANATPYHESVDNFAEVADAADDWREKTGISTKSTTSPLAIAIAPAEGRYGDAFRIAGTYTGGTPGTPIEVYVDSRPAGTAALGDDRTYNYLYRVGRTFAGPHLAYAVAGAVYSTVATFTVLSQNTTINLAAAEVNATAVACTGNLTTAEGLPVAGAPGPHQGRRQRHLRDEDCPPRRGAQPPGGVPRRGLSPERLGEPDRNSPGPGRGALPPPVRSGGSGRPRDRVVPPAAPALGGARRGRAGSGPGAPRRDPAAGRGRRPPAP